MGAGSGPTPVETATALPQGWNDRTQISSNIGRTTIQFEGRLYIPNLRPLVHDNGFTKVKGFHSHIDVPQNMRAQLLPAVVNFHITFPVSMMQAGRRRYVYSSEA